MATVAEVLKATGMTDDQIALIDAKALTAFSGVLTTAEEKEKNAISAAEKAEKERLEAKSYLDKAETERLQSLKFKEDTELAGRANTEFYEQKIMPSLTGWTEEKNTIENKRIAAEARAAFYETQAKAAKDAGFIPNDAPNFDPAKVEPNPNPNPNNNGGRYVANQPGSTPGSPTFLTPEIIASRIGDAANTITDIQWQYQSLFGTPMPIPPSQLIREADAQKLDPVAYAEKRFGFVQKKVEIAEKQQQERDAKLRAEAVAPFEKQIADKDAEFKKTLAQKEREWAEKGGNNPDIRRAAPSQNTEIARAVKQGERPDPLLMNDSQRHSLTRGQINDRISSDQPAA